METATSTSTVLPDDLRCAGCDYLLRGLDPQGRCPECNHPIRDSLAAQANLPTLGTLWKLLFGVLILAAILLGLPHVSNFAFSKSPARLFGFYVNRVGVFYLLEALLLLLPGWLLGRPGVRRGWVGWMVLAVPAALLLMSAVMFLFIQFSSRWGNLLLMCAYMLAPFAYSVQMILLLGLLIPHAARIPRGPRTRWVRAAQWSLGTVTLVESVCGVPMLVAEMLRQVGLMSEPTASRRAVPEAWHLILTPMSRFSDYAHAPALYFTVLVLLAYAYVIFQRMRVRAV